MIWLGAILVWLFETTLAADIHLWSGSIIVVPVLLFLTAGQGAWRAWFVWLGVLGLTSIWNPFSPIYFAAVLLLSGVAYLLFLRFIDHDNSFLRSVTILGLTAVFLALITFLALGRITLSIVGSLILTLPVIVGIYVYLNRPKRWLR